MYVPDRELGRPVSIAASGTTGKARYEKADTCQRYAYLFAALVKI